MIPVALPPGTRALRIERVCADDGTRYTSPSRYNYYKELVHDAHWRLWIHYSNTDATLGTFLQLNNDGSIYRTTVRQDEGDDVQQIKPADSP